MSAGLGDLLEAMADAIIESRPQNLIARDSGLSEKHVSQMLTGKVDGTLRAWQRMLDAAGLEVHVTITAAPVSGVAARAKGAGDE